MLRRCWLLVALSVLLVVQANGDRRKYVWTYAYQTMLQSATELEIYQTTRLEGNRDRWEMRLEIEQGLTPRWDVSIYQIFAQPEGGSFKWDAVQLRTRYRIGEAGQYLLDPLLYFEYNRKVDLTQPNKLEAKLILARTQDRFNIAFNPLYEYFFAPDATHEVGLDAGLSWEFVPAFAAGIESVTRIEFEDGESATTSYLGPTISFASGEWWYSIGAVFGLNEQSDDARVRFLMGVGL